MSSMKGNPVTSYIFRKKDQAVTMDTKSTIKIKDEHVHVDPQLLFQRLVMIGTKNGELQNVFQPQNPVRQMLCGVLRLLNFLDHLKQFNMS